MKKSLDLTVSIVLYNENLKELTKTVACFLEVSLKKRLFLIDNTRDKKFENAFEHDDIEYIPIEKNIGFGSGHNIILDRIANFSKYHLILNPDVIFKKEVIVNLIEALEQNKEVAMIAPKVLFPDGAHQFSCRRYPSLIELLVRRVPFLKSAASAIIAKGIYSDKSLSTSFFAEYITGCFQLYKTEFFVKIRGFDQRYFLYMEDVDICKKIEVLGKKKMYYPKEEIFHVLKQGSSKSLKLFFRHTLSAIKYFFKWGFTL